MLKKTVLVRALSIAFSAAALTAAVVSPVMAQSNASGNIVGTVDAPAGATINMVNTDTGLKRTVTLEPSGRYLATALPPGHYKVDLVRDGKVANSVEVDVIVGQGVDASFLATASTVQAVQVTGRRSRIDISNTNNGATFTARELAKLPISPSVSSIIQLAPNTTRGDSRYAAGDSFGGGGPSENAYYINGFPVTNPLTQLGASELPFGAIAQAQVLTGGFGAEFGRSVGGVVNITTKSGTNTWEAGVQAAIEPNSMRASGKNRYYTMTGDSKNALTDGQILRRRDNQYNQQTTYGAYVGGPIIKDKVFMFLSAETINNKFDGVNENFTGVASSNTAWLNQKSEVQRYMGKFDWNITDNHRLELTLIGDDAQSDRETYGYNFNTNTRNYTRALKGHFSNDTTGVYTPSSGGDVQILKYTGNLTDDLTLTAAGGKSKVKHENTFDLGTGVLNPATGIVGNGAAPNIVYPINTNPINFSINPDGAKDEVRSYRLDLEYKLGLHTLRGGIDETKLKSVNAGQVTPGLATWSYRKTDTPTTPIALGSGSAVAVATGGGLGTQGYYVRKVVFSTATDAASDQSAQYLEDRYQVTKNLLITGGLRWESFESRNGDNETFVEQKHLLAPRLSASWDVNGDASLKVYGSAGRYHLQLPTNVSIRGASRATNTQQFYTYTGVDSNGQPTGLVQLTGPRSANNELGQAKDPRTIAATTLDPSYQDELTLGFEKAFSPSLNFGAKGTFRKLKSTSDDFCDQTPFDDWALRHKVSTKNWTYGLGCVILNPGKSNTFLVDFENGTVSNTPKQLTSVTLSAEELGLPKAKREYKAVDLFVEHPMRNGWYGKVNYTWSRSDGNTEGQTNSDTGQANASITAVWDQKYLMEYSDGLLPNSRSHQIKAFGFYEITQEWGVGGNFLAASGRAKSCLGVHPDVAVQDLGYGAAYHYCQNAAGVSVPAPRGSYGKLPWDVRLDLNLAYQPKFIKGLQFKVDVYNVMNRQIAQNVQEQHDTDAGDGVFASYNSVLSYTTPRRARFTVQYDHKF